MNITPNANDLWHGIAGHFDSFSQVVSEFIDNSISDFQKNNPDQRQINLTFDENNGLVSVRIEDTGFGIGNFESALKLGDKTAQSTPLNEHGFGLKHALATANPENNNWKIFTRTKKEFEDGIYRQLSARYSFDMEPEIVEVAKNSWPGLYNSSGTIAEFCCSSSLFNTVQVGIPGKAGFDRCLDYLREELGYRYSGVIEKAQAIISISGAKSGYKKTVESVKPNWVGYYLPKKDNVVIDLGGGNIKIEYVFGEMGNSEYFRHYKRNMSTSGVEIRINGRLIMSNLFKEIWGIENHPSYNHFLAVINLVSENRDVLPKTRTSKNGIRSGDEKLEKLCEWIRNVHPKPNQELAGTVNEKELVKRLAKSKEMHIRNSAKCIETEFKVYTSIGSPVAVDLYVFDGQDIVIYEAKKDIADVQNVYQLVMYWDGAVADGRNPTEGILIASSHSPGVTAVIEYINTKNDRNGNPYRLSIKKWIDEGIDYPKP